jgi:isocitrate dehydrogenase kinase/phosphatase
MRISRSKNSSGKPLADIGANVIYAAFVSYCNEFNDITARADKRFKDRDWHAMRSDATERLSLYKRIIDRIEAEIRQLLALQIEDKQIWMGMRAIYSSLISARDGWELAETFFNSVTRRIFSTIGVDPQIEFVDTDFSPRSLETKQTIIRVYEAPAAMVDLIAEILTANFSADDFQDLNRECQWLADQLENRHQRICPAASIHRAEIVRSIFYRGMGAYIVGRLLTDSMAIPLAIALLNTAEGIRVDGILLEEDQISILFSFTHSYFHVEIERPHELIAFLKSILPRKRTAELYISTGFNKHGKTEFYREFLDHLTVCSDDLFEISPGEPGMVMIVFNMPYDDVVFKLIRDHFGSPKKVTRQEVKQKYDLVFEHDRAGRLVDAQTFEHLKFDACCFSEKLLNELQLHAGQTVRVENDHVVVEHAYVERRVTPLNIYLRQADQDDARQAVIDFGNAIKDLAISNIFAGDFLLKNFGVTRHGRVVFYDYDELCLLTTCNFKNLPQSFNFDDELAPEPWFYVNDNDVFPEEFQNFLGLPAALKEVFMSHHSDLLTVDFWINTQEKIKAGQLPHIFPYKRADRNIKEHERLV